MKELVADNAICESLGLAGKPADSSCLLWEKVPHPLAVGQDVLPGVLLNLRENLERDNIAYDDTAGLDHALDNVIYLGGSCVKDRYLWDGAAALVRSWVTPWSSETQCWSNSHVRRYGEESSEV